MQKSIQQKASFLCFFIHKIESALDRVQLWMDRYHQRQQLSQLSEHMLKDLGLNKADVFNEVRKPFWK